MISFDIRRDDESGQFRVSIKYGSKEDMDLSSQEDFTLKEAKALVERIRREAACAVLKVDTVDHRND